METATNYTEQAKNILAGMNVKFTAKFIKYDRYFADDNSLRDIFRITFSRNGNKFSLRFGQSLNNSTGNGYNKPTEYDVISCIQKYDVGSFEEFCAEFGYDTDSRKAFRTYKAVCKEYQKVSNFFTSEEIEQLQEIN